MVTQFKVNIMLQCMSSIFLPIGEGFFLQFPASIQGFWGFPWFLWVQILGKLKIRNTYMPVTVKVSLNLCKKQKYKYKNTAYCHGSVRLDYFMPFLNFSCGGSEFKMQIKVERSGLSFSHLLWTIAINPWSIWLNDQQISVVVIRLTLLLTCIPVYRFLMLFLFLTVASSLTWNAYFSCISTQFVGSAPPHELTLTSNTVLTISHHSQFFISTEDIFIWGHHSIIFNFSICPSLLFDILLILIF